MTPGPQGPRDAATRCGFVALLGAPNAGKSTLLNTVVGEKVSIVTHKVQTTRRRILGVRMEDRSQIVFVDTPGVLEPRRRLERAMVDAAWTGAREADIVVVLIDAAAAAGRGTERLLARAARRGRRPTIAVNKIDLVAKESLLPLTAALAASGAGDDIFYLSALTGEGVGELVAALAGRLPAGPWLYPPDQASDLPLRQLAAEIVREKLFLRLHRELPYAATVETELWTSMDDDSAVRIDLVVHVARKGHKPIVLGKGGRTIKDIGQAARRELEDLLERRVHLFLHVKVSPGWLDDPARYREMGLDYPA